MAATLRELLLHWQRRRTHTGFGQEPIDDQGRHTKNGPLALFVQEYGRAPEHQMELDAFMHARSRQALGETERPGE